MKVGATARNAVSSFGINTVAECKCIRCEEPDSGLDKEMKMIKALWELLKECFSLLRIEKELADAVAKIQHYEVTADDYTDFLKPCGTINPGPWKVPDEDCEKK